MWVDKLPMFNAAAKPAPLIVVRCYRTQTMLLGFIEKMFNTCVLFRAVDNKERDRCCAIHAGQCVRRGVSRFENGQKTMPPLPVAALGYLAVDAGCSLAGVGLAFAFAFFFGLSAWRTFCTMRSMV